MAYEVVGEDEPRGFVDHVCQLVAKEVHVLKRRFVGTALDSSVPLRGSPVWGCDLHGKAVGRKVLQERYGRMLQIAQMVKVASAAALADEVFKGGLKQQTLIPIHKLT